MYQSLTRAVPAAQNGELFNWLTNLYPIWANLTPEMIQVSTMSACRSAWVSMAAPPTIPAT
jgi:8-oxoguanine deaminase